MTRVRGFGALSWLGAVCLAVGCETEGGTEPTLPDVEQAEFVSAVDNPFMPLVVGTTWAIEAETDEGTERIEIEVLAETRDIQGVVATVVRDTAWLAGVMVEDTWDWFAQDSDGNVWYLGEDTCEIENDECASTEGSWEWGVEGALPGIVMPADPAVDGQPYYEEYHLGHAEDVGEVVAEGVSVTVAAGTWSGCIQVHETSTLDATLDELKTFCPGVGLVRVDEGDVVEELVEFSG